MHIQPKDPRWLMRWVTLITFLIAILASLIAGIILVHQTGSPTPLTISVPPLFAIRPIIHYLFPPTKK